MKKFLLSVALLCVSVTSLPAQNTLAGNLTVQQTVKFTGVLTPTQLAANVNDYAPTSFSTNTLLRISSDQAGRTVTGLAGGAAGRMVWLTNVGSYAIGFSDDSVSSSAANRFDFGASDFSLPSGGSLALWYDATSTRWRPMDSPVSGVQGTVTSVSVTTANGVSGSVATATTTPAITLTLGAITPSSVAAVGTVTGSNLSGTNTGDQTTVTGNAGTATALQTARNINGVAFDGTANITVTAAAGTVTGTTLASNVTASSLLSASGGSFGTAAFTNVTAYEVPLTFSSPLSRSVNTISIGNAAADGTTKGAATFTASDFDSSSGVISIDYTNGQTATGSVKGFLNSTDWGTFNAKQPAGNYITALTGDVTASGPGSSSATVTKINGVSLAGLATGILKNTTSTGAPSIAVAADFPTLNQNTTGSAGSLLTFQTAETNPVQILKASLFTVDASPFQIQQQSYANSGGGAGTFNHGTFLGYNCGHHSSLPIFPHVPALYMGLEDNFYDTVSDNAFGMEWYLEYYSPESSVFLRPIYTRVLSGSEVNSTATIVMDIGDSGDGNLTLKSGTSPLLVCESNVTNIYKPTTVVDTTDFVSSSQASFITQGGAYVAKKLYVNSTLTVNTRLGVGTDPDSVFSVNIAGKSRFGGTLGINTDPSDANIDLKDGGSNIALIRTTGGSTKWALLSLGTIGGADSLDLTAVGSANSILHIEHSGEVTLGTSTAVSGALLTVNGSVGTAAPSGGASAAWKLGGYSSGLVRIDIAGTGYDLAASGQDLRTSASPSFSTITASTKIVTSTHTPSSASDTGTAGTITWDSSFIYICTATNTWKRVAISTW